jgi:hypothetical protein
VSVVMLTKKGSVPELDPFANLGCRGFGVQDEIFKSFESKIFLIRGFGGRHVDIVVGGY